MRIMTPAMNPLARTQMLGAMQKGATPEFFDAIIESRPPRPSTMPLAISLAD